MVADAGMLTTLFAQTVLLPVSLVLVTVVLHYLFYTKEVQEAGALALASPRSLMAGDSILLTAWFLLLFWLPSYYWITQRFVWVPSLSTDWLPIYVVAVLFGAYVVNYLQASRWWLMAVAAVIATTIAWPLLSYGFTWASHFRLLAEVLVWFCVLAALHSNYFLRATQNTAAILLLLVNGGLGLVVMLHSSLKLGLLVCAYASIFLLVAYMQLLKLVRRPQQDLLIIFNQAHVLWGFTGLLLGVAWFYVQIPLLLTLMLLCAIAAPIFYRGVGQVVVSALFTGAAVCYAVVEQIILAPAYAY